MAGALMLARATTGDPLSEATSMPRVRGCWARMLTNRLAEPAPEPAAG